MKFHLNHDHQVEDKDEEACYPVSDLCPSCNSGSGHYGDQESIDLSLVDFVDLSRTLLTQQNRDDFKNHYDAAKQKEKEQQAFKALSLKRQVLEKIKALSREPRAQQRSLRNRSKLLERQYLERQVIGSTNHHKQRPGQGFCLHGLGEEMVVGQ